MSNPLALAAVTLTLQAVLNGVISDPDLTDATVTILPPDKARGTNSARTSAGMPPKYARRTKGQLRSSNQRAATK